MILEDGRSIEAITYFALNRNIVDDGQPSEEYLIRILTGANQHGLPPDCIEKIRQLGRK